MTRTIIKIPLINVISVKTTSDTYLINIFPDTVHFGVMIQEKKEKKSQNLMKTIRTVKMTIKLVMNR